jgi:hypothetical protein
MKGEEDGGIVDQSAVRMRVATIALTDVSPFAVA